MAANPWNIAAVGLVAVGGLFALKVLKKKTSGGGSEETSGTGATPISPYWYPPETPMQSPSAPLFTLSFGNGSAKSATTTAVDTSNESAQQRGDEILGNDSIALSDSLVSLDQSNPIHYGSTANDEAAQIESDFTNWFNAGGSAKPLYSASGDSGVMASTSDDTVSDTSGGDVGDYSGDSSILDTSAQDLNLLLDSDS